MASRPLEGPGGARHRQGPPGINAVVKRNRLSKKKKFRPRTAFDGFEAAGGSWGGQTLSGTTRDQCCGQKEPLEPKKNFGLGQPLMALRLLEGSGGAGHHQGPSGIDTGVKRNHLSQKKIRPRPAFDSLWRPPEAVILEG